MALQRSDGGIVLNIPLSGSLQNPAFSPDGKTIVFTRFLNGYNKEPSELYKFDLDTEKLTLLVSDGSGNISLPGSVWNSTIDKIIFSSSREPHDEIYLIPENGTSGDETQITNRPDHVAYEPSISQDGEWTVFESHLLDVEGDGIITKYKLNGSSSFIPLTEDGDDCRQPNWSPDNAKILYQKFEQSQWDVWIMNIDGNEKFKVTSGTGDKTDASFTNDGQFIVYSTDFELSLANIYKISINGGDPSRLTEYDGYDGAPSISPSGDKLIFESTNGDPDNSQGTKLVMKSL